MNCTPLTIWITEDLLVPSHIFFPPLLSASLVRLSKIPLPKFTACPENTCPSSTGFICWPSISCYRVTFTPESLPCLDTEGYRLPSSSQQLCRTVRSKQKEKNSALTHTQELVSFPPPRSISQLLLTSSQIAAAVAQHCFTNTIGFCKEMRHM